MEMGMSDDVETILLAEGLLKSTKLISYEDYSRIRHHHTLYEYDPNDYNLFHDYILFIRDKYFPGLIYSPYTKTFKEYVGS